MGVIIQNGETYSSDNNVNVINEYKAVQKVDDFTFDNSRTSLRSTELQGAIDELAEKVEQESILQDMRNSVNGFIITVLTTDWTRDIDGTYYCNKEVPELLGDERLDVSLYNDSYATKEEAVIFDQIISEISTSAGNVNITAVSLPTCDIRILLRGCISSTRQYLIDLEDYTKAMKSGNIFSYKTVAEMKKSANLIVEGTICKTSGYYEINDGGGAYYVIRGRAGMDTSNKDGYTFISLANNMVADLIVDNNSINIAQLGALPYDDEMRPGKDNTNIIQFALNNFNEVYMNTGKYLVSGPIRVSNKEHVIFHGNGSTILQNSVRAVTDPQDPTYNYLYGTLTFSSIKSLEVLDLNVDNMNPSDSSFKYAGIRISNSDNFLVRNCSINAHNYGIYVYDSTNGIIENIISDRTKNEAVYVIGGCNNIVVENSIAKNPSTIAFSTCGTTVMEDMNPRNIRFVNCQVTDMDIDQLDTDSSYALFYVQAAKNIVFESCSIDDGIAYGTGNKTRYPILLDIASTSSSNITISNCLFEMTEEQSMRNTDTIKFINGTTDKKISNVKVENTKFIYNAEDRLITSAPILIMNAKNVLLSHCKVDTCNMTIENSDKVIVENSDIINTNTFKCINSSNIDIHNNTINCLQTGGIINFPINVTDCELVSILCNNFVTALNSNYNVSINCSRVNASKHKLDSVPYMDSNTVNNIQGLEIINRAINITTIPSKCFAEGQLIVNEAGVLTVNQK